MSQIHDSQPHDLYEAISDSNINNEMLIATVIRGGDAGEKALITDGAITWSNVQDGFFGKHEAEVTAAHESGILKIEGQDVFTELLGNEKKAVIFGAGHVSLPVITLMKMLGMNVTVVEDREEFAGKARKQGADRVICKSFAEAFEEIEGDDDTFFIIITRGHRYDTDCAGGALRSRHAYVGMIGSKRHGAIVRNTLLESGLSEELVDSIHTPIGLSIGAETPEEIAVSIAAEIIEVKNRKRRNFGFSKEMLREILSEERDPEILATIVSRTGSAPRTVGTKMLVHRDGTITGTIGGGSGEAEIIDHAKRLLREGFSGIQLRTVDMMVKAGEDGMVCGGGIEVLLETV